MCGLDNLALRVSLLPLLKNPGGQKPHGAHLDAAFSLLVVIWKNFIEDANGTKDAY
jgi:hypothetical protein